MDAREVVVAAFGGSVEKNWVWAIAARELIILKTIAGTTPPRVVVVEHKIAKCLLADELSSLYHQVHVHDKLPFRNESLPHHVEGHPKEIP